MRTRHHRNIELNDWLQINNITGLVFDLDDTVIVSTEIFADAINEVIELYARILPSLSREKISETLKKIDTAMHAIYSVNPLRWKYIIHQLEKELGIWQSQEKKALHIFSKIYVTQPKFEAGAEQVLQYLKYWQYALALVTHANVEWTIFKLSGLGLENFFDHVEIVDENKPQKGKSDWLAAARQLGIDRDRLLGAGDNIKGDVHAAVEAGFGKVVWVDKKNGWEVYRQGEIPTGVLKVEKLGDLLNFSSS